jgi:uncharacterized membrane protein YozB (DUF420 family)
VRHKICQTTIIMHQIYFLDWNFDEISDTDQQQQQQHEKEIPVAFFWVAIIIIILGYFLYHGCLQDNNMTQRQNQISLIFCLLIKKWNFELHQNRILCVYIYTCIYIYIYICGYCSQIYY